MTTPKAMDHLLDNILERFHDASQSAEKTETAAASSWGAAYNRGYADAIGDIYESITGDRPPVSRPTREAPHE